MNNQESFLLAKPLPCPFCGDEPEWECHEDPTYPQVECRNIECPIGCASDIVSLESWNTRKYSQNLAVLGVRDDLMPRIKNLLLALCHQGDILEPDQPPYDVGDWGIREAQELYEIIVTQQNRPDLIKLIRDLSATVLCLVEAGKINDEDNVLIEGEEHTVDSMLSRADAMLATQQQDKPQ